MLTSKIDSEASPELSEQSAIMVVYRVGDIFRITASSERIYVVVDVSSNGDMLVLERGSLRRGGSSIVRRHEIRL